MPRLLIGLLALILALPLGCGGDAKPKPKPRADTTPAEKAGERCSRDDDHLTVADVFPRPPGGAEVAKGDEDALRQFTDPLEQALGDKLAGIETGVIVPPDARSGTIVLILNGVRPENPGPDDDAVAGARDAAKGNNGEFSEIRVAGRRAALVHYPKLSVVALKLSPCATTQIMDVDRKRLVRTARAIVPPG